MKGYRKILERTVTFSKFEIEADAHMDGMDQELRSVMAEMLNHYEKTGIREFEITVRAKKVPV